MSNKEEIGKPIKLLMDNKAAVIVANTGELTKRMRHIETRYYYLADQVAKGHVAVSHVATEENPSDLMTKAVKPHTFESLIGRLVQ